MVEPLLLEVWQEADGIGGWLTRAEADLLWRLCDGVWCEIGCWYGRSARILAATGHPGYCVDPFREGAGDVNTRDEFHRNLGPFLNVTGIELGFREAEPHVPDGLRFLHLDADHSYEATREAWELYAPKVERGGFVVLHDAWVYGVSYNPWPGVTRFVEDDLLGNQGWEHYADAERSAAFRKR